MQINEGKRSKFIHIKWLNQKNSNDGPPQLKYCSYGPVSCIVITSNYIIGFHKFIRPKNIIVCLGNNEIGLLFGQCYSHDSRSGLEK
jgi:hypothetical protein